jgi:hypothetical protein
VQSKLRVRDLTPSEIARLLTQEEVNQLLPGTKVMVKWNGGNGPIPYTILRQTRFGPVVNSFWHSVLSPVAKTPAHNGRSAIRVFLQEEPHDDEAKAHSAD